MPVRCVLLLPLLFCIAFAAGGCAGGYVLRGRVIEGVPGGIHTVPAAELEQDAPTVGGVQISLYRDPTRPNRQLVASGISAGDGTFAIPVDAFGAGWMEEQWLIEATHEQHQNTRMTLRLPADANRTRLLIIVSPGRGTPAFMSDDLMDEYRRYR